jgi:Mg-chelatase subunit ChlD
MAGAAGGTVAGAAGGTTSGGGTTGGTSAGGVGGTGAGGVGGTSGGAGTGGGAGGATSGGGVCESNSIQTQRLSPDMLIVLDRSLSMEQGWRWDPSVNGVKAITAALQADVAFGLMTFPGTSGGSVLPGTDLTCATGSLNVPIAHNNATAISQALDATSPEGATPTAATLQAAHAELGKIVVSPDEVASPKYVLLVTDGAPNCTNGSFGGGGQDSAAVAASVSAIQTMAQSGIKTYVVGYDTQNDAALRSALDQMARAGGTGDTAHRAIENESGLIAAFQQITSTALSCEFALEKQVADKIYVRVALDGRQLVVDDPNGWVLSADRRKVLLQGSACSSLSGPGHLLNVTVECQPVPPPG